MNRFFITIIILFFYLTCYSQPNKIKFGKVSKDELKMQEYPNDTSANAVVLSDIAELRFFYNNDPNSNGFEYEFTRHLRIKIFNKSAFDYANQEILLRHSPSSQERVTKLKAFTFNLVKGKSEKDKVTQRDIMRKKYNDNIDIAKFTMPNVREGSVIDIEYTLRSDYLYYLRTWNFQYEIPVQWSEYYLSIPEYFNYSHFFEGVQDLVINSQSKKTERFIIRWETERTARNISNRRSETMPHKHTEELNPTANVLHFAAKNVPAFKKEPYMASIDNYIFRVKFELSWTKYPYSTAKSYAKSWEAVNKDLINRSDFGGLLNSNIPKELVSDIIKGLNTDEEKMYAIFNYVKNNIRWNGKKKLISESSLRNILKDKTGSSAEINMLLVVMLREAGINSHPVVASTRDNGIVNTNRPGYEQFNYTLAYALINQQSFLMDATDPYCFPNFLPERCLNGQARIVSENFTDWINLNANFTSKEITGGNFTFDEDDNFIGKIQNTKNHYFAYDFREKLDDYANLDKYIEEYQNENHNIEISDYSFENIDSLFSPIKSSYTVKIKESTDKIGDMIIFNPLNIYAESDNPFKADQRKYPINYVYPFEQLYVMNYQIPEGYKVEEMPQSIQLVTPDNSATFLYKIIQSGSIIQVTCKKNISKTFYMPAEYKIIKDFYNQMIAKQAENIVLKKII